MIALDFRGVLGKVHGHAAVKVCLPLRSLVVFGAHFNLGDISIVPARMGTLRLPLPSLHATCCLQTLQHLVLLLVSKLLCSYTSHSKNVLKLLSCWFSEWLTLIASLRNHPSESAVAFKIKSIL